MPVKAAVLLVILEVWMPWSRVMFTQFLVLTALGLAGVVACQPATPDPPESQVPSRSQILPGPQGQPAPQLGPAPGSGSDQTVVSPEIVVDPNVRITSDPWPFGEPSIAADPENPGALIVSSSEFLVNQGIVTGTFVTDDGGRTWKRSVLPGMREGLARRDYVHVEDSWTTCAARGVCYLSALTESQQGKRWRTHIVVYRSDDRGHTWQGPALLPGDSYDRTSIVAVGDRVYVESGADTADPALVQPPQHPSVAAMVLLRSDDRGRTFHKVALVSPNNLGQNPMNIVAMPDGSLVFGFNDHPATGKELLSAGRMYVIHAADRGANLGVPQLIADSNRPSVIGFLDADLSPSKFRGRVYATWESGELSNYYSFRNVESPQVAGKTRSVSVAHSTDSGRSWSRPITLRADAAGPAFFATPAVNRDGVVGVVWLQHELDHPARLCYRVYFSASLDGGDSFTPPRPVSDAVSCPDSEANRIKAPEDEVLFPDRARGGEYFRMAAAADGSFHPVWPDGRNGAFQLYTSRIVVKRTPPAGASGH
jgi:hypothetical protein